MKCPVCETELSFLGYDRIQERNLVIEHLCEYDCTECGTYVRVPEIITAVEYMIIGKTVENYDIWNLKDLHKFVRFDSVKKAGQYMKDNNVSFKEYKIVAIEKSMRSQGKIVQEAKKILQN